MKTTPRALALLCVALSGVWGACTTGSEGGRLLPTSYDGALVVEPDPVTFDDTRAGCVRSRSLELVNTSAEFRIAVTNVRLPDADLGLGDRLPIRLEPGERRTVDLHFTPESAGGHSGDVEIVTDEGRLHPYRLPVRADAVPRPTDVASGPVRPLDLVFVLDVSTTMNELSRLRAAVESAYAVVEARGGAVRFGLTTFENGVHVHRDGAFLDRQAFFDELDALLLPGSWVPDPDRPRQLMNFDLQENVLDALAWSAEGFDLRPNARHDFLLMTDDTFREPPEVFSDGTPALHSYEQVAAALEAHGIRLFSVHAPLRGRGLSSDHDGEPSLVERTGGDWFDIADVDRGALDLDVLLSDLLAGRTCR
jgi:hypothetical protein